MQAPRRRTGGKCTISRCTGAVDAVRPHARSSGAVHGAGLAWAGAGLAWVGAGLAWADAGLAW
eukprot:362460-Chlamydomonas_euryale.AAC.4